MRLYIGSHTGAQNTSFRNIKSSNNGKFWNKGARNAQLSVIDADSLACACGILALVVPEQKKGNLRLLLKFILRQFASEDVEGSVDGGFSWYTKLHNYLNKFTSKKVIQKTQTFSCKQKSEISGKGLFDNNQLSTNFIWRD